MFNENSDFYPTPNPLIRRMLEKLDFETFHKTKYILEPSCGKGDIIEYYKEYYKNKSSRYMNYNAKVEDYITFDAIEIDENLSNLLRGKNINVIWDDFLTFEPSRFYDLIIANFPFSNGVEHALKSIQIQERIGGQIICILNSESIKNPYSNNRKELVQLLEKYNADIEYIDNAFSDAERETNVQIALIYINIPMQDTETMFEREFKRENPNIEFNSFQALIPNMNKLEKLIFECDLIKKSGIELFKEKFKVDKLLEGVNLKSKLNICDDSYKSEAITINYFINKINLEYWNKFINETDFRNRLPSKLRNNFSYNMERQKDICFNMENVRYFYEELIKSIPKSYEETVANVFDDVTRKYVYTDSTWNQTIHYYNGWKTNDSFKINKKVIIPCGHGTFSYNIPDVLADLNIIFENISGKKDDLYKDNNKLWESIKHNEKKIMTEFFFLDSYKKGTLHISFRNEEYLNQFNILASKGKNWLPGDFGQKHYSDMNEEEKILVSEFGLSVDDYTKLCVMNSQNNLLRLTN